MEGLDEVDMVAENFDTGVNRRRTREDQIEHSRSGGSKHFDGESSDDQDPADESDQPRRKKAYHRHTPSQIKELEAFFKENPHPDGRQRLELGMRLGLEIKQVKFWFQNRRTQMKTQQEHHDNIILKRENDKLRVEIKVMKAALSNPMCHNCGGPAIPGQLSFAQQQLSNENTRLNNELTRISTFAQNFIGKPTPNLPPSPSLPGSRAGGLNMPMGLYGMNGVGFSSRMMHFPKTAMPFELLSPSEKSAHVEVAEESMAELVKMAQVDSPMWITSYDGKHETLNAALYKASSCISRRKNELVNDASRASGLVIINGENLVETMMDAKRWQSMFPAIVAKASTVGTIASCPNGTRNGPIQMMAVELRMLSPLVPSRVVNLIRFSKQLGELLWGVVDFSLDVDQGGSNVSYRRLPSGFIVQDLPNGYSKVTWIEHSEYDERLVHQMLQPILRTGIGFGAQRWLATLQRECNALSFLMASTDPDEDPRGKSMNSKKSILRLAQRMMQSFFSGVCGSSVHPWEKIHVENVSENVKILVRPGMEGGEPSGYVLSASTSVWMPVSRATLFDFLRDWQTRGQWDILVDRLALQVMAQIDKDQDGRNSIALLTAKGLDGNNMMLFQETVTDASGSIIVYAPINSASSDIMKGVVLEGGDSSFVEILPSGFSIVPCVTSDNVKSEGTSSDEAGCMLTVGFQIVCDGGQPTSNLTMHSMQTVIDLISTAIKKINNALQVNDIP